MLSSNTTEPWPNEDLSSSTAQLGSNSEVSVGSIDPRHARRQISLGTLPSTPSVPLPLDRSTGVRNNLSFPKLLGKDILIIAGPTPLPERFEKNLGSVALAFESVRARLEQMKTHFSGASLEIRSDPDHLDSESLLVVIRINGVPYKEILKMWDTLSRVFAQRLTKNLIGNVHLVLRPGE
jgi:hypothetical protein